MGKGFGALAVWECAREQPESPKEKGIRMIQNPKQRREWRVMRRKSDELAHQN